MSVVRRDQFAGSNNIAKPERLPEGAVVDAVNMDFTVGGKAELRTGFSKVRDCSNARAIFDMGSNGLALVDGEDLIRVDQSGSETFIAKLSAGHVAATLHNNLLYLNTAIESIVVGETVEQWSVEPPAFDVSLTSGNMAVGLYKVAVTKLANGKESGCIPAVISVGQGQSIVVSSAGSGNRLYCSVANGQTLYYQGTASHSNYIANPVDDTERLETDMLQPFPFCEILDSHKGLIVGARGRFLFYSMPLQPHLFNPEVNYIQFPCDIELIASVADGVYVCADKTYFISSIGSDNISQRVVLDFGAVKGTAVKLPNKTVAWFSKYGQVMAGPEGITELINKASYSPETASDGAAGFLEHNGNQMITTSMRGEQKGSRLQSNDHWDLEVI